MFVVGVDGCKGGWVMVALADGKFAGAAKVSTFADVLEAADGAVAVGVDMPIGLLPSKSRVCDALAKRYVGARRASVFITPPRESLEAESYQEANALCRMLTDSGLSKQAYALRAKIFDVESGIALAASEPLPDSAETRLEISGVRESLRKYSRKRGRSALSHTGPLPGGRVVEVHPECSFRTMAGAELPHNKKSYNGMMLRRSLLDKEGIVIPVELEEIGGVAVDDVFDAGAVAWSAHRYATGTAVSLPPRELWQFEGERPVAIWM